MGEIGVDHRYIHIILVVEACTTVVHYLQDIFAIDMIEHAVELLHRFFYVLIYVPCDLVEPIALEDPLVTEVLLSQYCGSMSTPFSSYSSLNTYSSSKSDALV